MTEDEWRRDVGRAEWRSELEVGPNLLDVAERVLLAAIQSNRADVYAMGHLERALWARDAAAALFEACK
jgi:hypothetical protein